MTQYHNIYITLQHFLLQLIKDYYNIILSCDTLGIRHICEYNKYFLQKYVSKLIETGKKKRVILIITCSRGTDNNGYKTVLLDRYNGCIEAAWIVLSHNSREKNFSLLHKVRRKHCNHLDVAHRSILSLCLLNRRKEQRKTHNKQQNYESSTHDNMA